VKGRCSTSQPAPPSPVWTVVFQYPATSNSFCLQTKILADVWQLWRTGNCIRRTGNFSLRLSDEKPEGDVCIGSRTQQRNQNPFRCQSLFCFANNHEIKKPLGDGGAEKVSGEDAIKKHTFRFSFQRSTWNTNIWRGKSRISICIYIPLWVPKHPVRFLPAFSSPMVGMDIRVNLFSI